MKCCLRGRADQEKNPGQMRVSQNWIGPAGCTLRDASFVPPNVDDMADALSEMEAFVNNEHGIDPIVKAALVIISLRPSTRFSMATEESEGS